MPRQATNVILSEMDLFQLQSTSYESSRIFERAVMPEKESQAGKVRTRQKSPPGLH
jgi:hypothetical protein